MDPNQPYYQFSNTGSSSAPVQYFGEFNESQWEDPSFPYGEEETLQPLPNGADIYPDDPFPPSLQTWPYFPNQQYDQYPQSERYNHFQTHPQGPPGPTFSWTHGNLTCLNCENPPEPHGVRCQSCRNNRSISPEVVRHCMKCLVPIEAPNLFCYLHHGRSNLSRIEFDHLKQNGVCFYCFSREVQQHASCMECRSHHVELTHSRERERVIAGYCKKCGRNRLDNSTEICNKCRERNQFNVRSHRFSRACQNFVWR